MKKIILLMLFSIVGWQQALAQSFSNGGVNYNVTSPTTVEVGNQGQAASGTVFIPQQVINNFVTYSVTSVGDYAFLNCNGLASVAIPNTVTSIGAFAFVNCSGLSSVNIPNSVSVIGDSAFQGCSGLTLLTIPNSVTSIGTAAFYECSGLTLVTISNSITSISDNAFTNCSGLTSLTIPNSITSIGSNAFSNCSGLTSLIIPNSVTSIGQGSFGLCTGLISLAIPNSLTSIGEYAFYNCSGLTSVICDISLPLIINANVFGAVNQGTCSLIVLSGSEPAYQTTAVWQNFAPITCLNPTNNTTTVSACGSYTWADNGQTYYVSGVYTGSKTNCITEKLALTITDPTGFSIGGLNYVVTSPTTVAVGNSAGVSGSIVIPTSVNNVCGNYFVTGIGDYAFLNCNGLTSVTIPNSVTSIGAFAFVNCSGLPSVTIPNSITTIGDSAFQGCSGLTLLAIPNSVTSIGAAAFYECSSLTFVTISNSITSISDNAFTNCFGLTSLTIPNSITSIGSNAFSNCTGLTSLSIPNSVTNIGQGSFGLCSGLISLAIPNSLTNIGEYAFYNCSGLTSVICNISLPLIINANVFGAVNQGTCSLKVPPAGLATYQTAAVWKDFMVLANIPTIKVRANQCGTTLVVLNAAIAADVVAGAQMYRFEVSNGTIVRTYETTKYNFDLTKIAGSNYGTTYAVRVAVKVSNIWGVYGSSCNISTPAITSSSNVPTTKMRLSQCGSTLPAIDSPIHSELVYGAQAYRFQLTNGATVTEVESPIYYFFLTNTALGTYGTTFSVKTKAKINGIWGNYGVACSISTPVLTAGSVPTTQLLSSFCNTTLASLNAKIGANTVYNADSYRFKIVKGGTATFYVSPIYNFRLSDAGILASSGTTYAISVAAKVNGVYGNYGVACNVTTPGAAENSKQATESTLIETVDFNLVAYPNPFKTDFKIQVNGANDDSVSILVFDMLGKKIENKNVKANEIENISLGQNYASGIYNVIVSQGSNSKTVRLVKN